MTWHIPLSDLDYGPEEEAAVLRVLKSKWLSMGPETKAFEEEFAASVGTKHAIAVSNGTAALHLAFLALGIGPGEAIIQPAVNFVASANMTKAVGAIPVFADINALDEPTLSPTSVEERISAFSFQLSAFRPKAVVVMHYGGHCCRMSEIREICRQQGLALIEDACHALGARYSPIPDHASPTSAPSAPGADLPSPNSDLPAFTLAVGSLGDIGCFSFFSNKNLVTGEGGMVTTDRDDIADKVRNLRSHGMSTLTWDRHRGHAATYDVLAHGYNYRLDDLRSALGREQLKKLERNNQRRRELIALYWDKLAPLEQHGWTLPFKRIGAEDRRSKIEDRSSPSHLPTPISQLQAKPISQLPSAGEAPLPSSISYLPSSCAAHLMAVVAPDAELRWRCAETLKAAGIQTSLHYPFVPGFSAFPESGAAVVLANSAAFSRRVITLPLYPTMTEAQVETVCTVLSSVSKSDL
jgi:dTDP-4-amino-4,6-dideoxygalactose transaminase